MRTLLTYIATGMIFVMPGEFLNQVLVHRLVLNYGVTLSLYVVLLLVGYAVHVWLRPVPKRTELACTLLLSVVLGLAVEWFLLGNAPWQNPEAVQVSMLAWWVGLFLVPRLFLESASYARLKRWFLSYHIIFSSLFLAMPMLMPGEGGLWLSVATFSYGLLLLLPLETWYIIRAIRS